MPFSFYLAVVDHLPLAGVLVQESSNAQFSLEVPDTTFPPTTLIL